MSDPALEHAISNLSAVVTRLNEASDTLNARIAGFEKTLIELNPGLEAWCPNPIRLLRVEANQRQAHGSQLGFAKNDVWGLWVRRGFFFQAADNKSWAPVNGFGWKLVRLTDATREERVGALEEFQTLVELLTTEAKQRLEMVERATNETDW
jgi:hypothetical protein